MIKVVHIIIGLNVGGAELMLKRLVTHSSQQSNEFKHIIISLTDLGIIGKQLQHEGIAIHYLGMSSLKSLPKTIYQLQNLLKKMKPDVVQTWMYHADFLGGLAAKSIGIKNIIWGIRTTDVSQGASKLTVYLSKLCAKLSYIIPNTIVCAAHVSKDYHISIGYDKSKMTVIPNGFDLKALSTTTEAGLEIRRQNNLKETDVVIGSIGRFNPVKNQKLFIETAAELVKEKPNLKFIMVGRDNTIHNKELMSWIKSYDLEENFRLLGQRSDIPQCLKAMNIFCLHSKTEGFPNVIGEAVLTETPCASVNVGDVTVLLDKESITKSNDKYELIRIINSHLTTPKNILEEKVKLNKEQVEKNYSIENIIEKYHDLYLTGRTT
ncbi:glycosyltransferase family 4 protein [Psychrobacter sp. FDAARGOS_221]|uniref:glycosyltransferase family 4 protein n=1 Tax=Psychrobacter sp. FDAARGOS_221 TaxID=1975705 RepID=UPI000BB54011|nr:glycosyltransferase [Psychrobacter sp. FDAARGOS_221]PNK60505.1 glycosyl transferase [Psychrobacter sp. FDAARGOS_221]